MRSKAENGEVDVWLGGRVRTLVLRARALRYIEEKTGKSFMSLDPGSIGIGFLHLAIMAGIHYHEPKTTSDHVDQWLDELGLTQAPDGSSEDLATLITKIGEALASGMPGARAMTKKNSASNGVQDGAPDPTQPPSPPVVS